MKKIISAALIAALGIQLIGTTAWAKTQTELSEIPAEAAASEAQAQNAASGTQEEAVLSEVTEETAKAAEYVYPEDWDDEDPLNQRAYEQIYGTSQKLTESYIASDTAPDITTTWSTYSGASTFIHNSANTTDRTLVVGIDVSYHNGSINWEKVKADGVEFAIIRAGYRGASAGSLNKDTQFENYIQGAQAAGLKVGVYFFSQALTKAEAREEANYTLSIIDGYKLDLPVAFDYEDYSGGRLTNANLSKTAKTNNTLAFCETIEAAGYKAMLYANSSWFYSQLDAETIGKSYMLWMARYNSFSYDAVKDSGTIMYPGQIDIWQCTSTAQVSGISTNVDLDYWYSTESNAVAVSQSARTKASVTVSWSTLSSADGYAVLLSDSRNGTYNLVSRVDSSVQSYRINGLEQGTQYYVKVRGYTTDENGKITNGKLSSPTPVTTKETLATRITTTKAVALRKWAGTSFTKLVSVPKATTLRVTAVTAAKNGKVWYKVTYKKGKTSYTGYIPSTGTAQCVKTVTGLNQSACKANKISLKWTKVPEASGYVIYRSTSPNGKFKKVAKVTGRASVTYTDTGLKQGWEYYYTVRAYKIINGSRTYATASSAATLHTKKSADTISVTTKVDANLRKSAGTSYSSLATVPANRTFTVLFRTKDKTGATWYKVKYKVNGKTKTVYLSASTVKKS